jgi:hypothetical protein
MAEIVIKLNGDRTFKLSFHVEDMYIKTRLGCHAGTLGCFNSVFSDAIGIDAKAEFKKHNIAEKIMDELVKGADKAWGGWSDKGEGDKGSTYKRKAHWIISAPWREDYHYFGTADVMAMIVKFCEENPKKYGNVVITPPTDCAAHGNNYGGPRTRTLVWMPPYVRISKTAKGWSTGFFPSEKKTKKKIEPKPSAAV